MTRAVRLRDEAERDIAEAASWYEQQQTGLGQEFLDEALRSFQSIAESPTIYRIVRRKARRALMKRFPFGIYYRIERETIVVLAVMHGSRHPRRWQVRT